MQKDLLLSFQVQHKYDSRVLQVVRESEPNQPDKYFALIRNGGIFYWLLCFADYDAYPNMRFPMENYEASQILHYINTVCAYLKQEPISGLHGKTYSLTVYTGYSVSAEWWENQAKGGDLLNFGRYLEKLVNKYFQISDDKKVTASSEDPYCFIIDFDIAGIDFLQSAPICQRLQVGDELEVVPEKNNPYCKLAARLEWHGQPVGYIPIGVIRTMGALIHRGLGSKCVVTEIKPGESSIPEITVNWLADSRT